MKKSALITGVSGQDGAYLSRYLIGLGYSVYGGVRRLSTPNYWRLEELRLLEEENFKLVDLDICDGVNCRAVISEIKPTELYNLAAQSFVGTSFNQPTYTQDVTGNGCLNLLEAIKQCSSDTKFYQASTSELYGLVQAVPQDETTPFYPRSPYAIAKQYAHWMTINYRESYNIFASTGILFNHESPLRGEEFVTRKITKSVAQIKHQQLDLLELGNLDAKRDWGYAKEYVEGMYKILQHDIPDNFVLATGQTSSVRDFLIKAFEVAEIELVFEGDGVNEVGRDKKTSKVLVKVNPKWFRPAEVELLIGNPDKAKRLLNWQHSTNIDKLAQIMVQSDLDRL